MNRTREHYFKTLGFSPRERGATEKLKAALDRAYDLRSFEIEHYWKRATYFWGFQIAIFAAFGLIWRNGAETGWELITVALSALGLITAFANRLTAKGSKFWQSNWESHIDMLEDELEGRLHKIAWLDKGRVDHSVSRVNVSLTSCFVVFWFFIYGYSCLRLLSPPSWFESLLPAKQNQPLIFVTASFVAVCLAILLLWQQTTNLEATVPGREGQHGPKATKVRFMTRTVHPVAPEGFVRRIAPGEAPTDRRGSWIILAVLGLLKLGFKSRAFR